MIGKTLGHYQIISQLGKGGMGEVFQAKDQVLGRDVAIKVLPEEFAKDADRVARFQREAKLLASLNHPNIAAIHGLEESGGTNFLVLELVEGETLADRIKQGPIPVEEVLNLALQIAEALEAAHDKGVIHRDLKPSNIKVTPDGKVKVLDFGLAKAFAGEQAELNLSNSPTLSNAVTQQGVILGTAAYMSPEQARGESVDKKADIWAFGCVLFEMLTGRGTFEGRTVSDILASVIKSEPGWERLPPNLHPRIRLLLERCLEKEAKNRYGVISDARVDIQKALADPSGVLVQPVAAIKPRRSLRTILPWIAAIILAGTIVGLAVWKLKPTDAGPVMRFEYEVPEGQQFGNLNMQVLAVSPNGRQFVYSTAKGLYLRSMDELKAKLIAGTEGRAEQPFFSPNGKWIGYCGVNRKLKKIAASGGAPIDLCDAPEFAGGSWNTDNTIVYGEYPHSITRISADGTNPEHLVTMNTELLLFPQILPDGESVLYTAAAANFTGMRVMARSLKSGASKELFAGIGARYLPTGHIIHCLQNDSNLYATPFDLDRLEVSGKSVPVVEGVFQAGGILQYAVSDSGTLVYMPSIAGAATSSRRTLVWVDRNGKEEPIAAAPGDYRFARISPDGTKVAWALHSGDRSDIWIWDLIREIPIRLTSNGVSSAPLWTPDGRRIVFVSDVLDKTAIRWKAANAAGADEMIFSVQDRGFVPLPSAWSIDGKIQILTVFSLTGGTGLDIGALSIDGDRKLAPLLREKYNEAMPDISPDGRWMAYVSDVSGQLEVYVRPFPDANKELYRVSTSGGDSPLWSPDGRELFYRSGDSAMTVALQTEPTLKLGKPEVLFRGNYVSLLRSLPLLPWDISPDGKRFLMMKELHADGSAGGGPRKINVVVNWFEELKQRVPLK